ncbi:hypothetical protein PRNP1_013260 [Phytophthora ramorum]
MTSCSLALPPLTVLANFATDLATPCTPKLSLAFILDDSQALLSPMAVSSPEPTLQPSPKQRKRNASALTAKEKRQCCVEGCTNYTIDRGLCFRHGGGKSCSKPGCTASAKHRGLCWKHGGSTLCTVHKRGVQALDKNQLPPSQDQSSLRRKKAAMRNFEDRERRGIIAELLKRSTNGELERGALAELAEELGRNRSTISRIWIKYTEAVAEGNEDEGWRSGKKQRCGRKKVDRQELQALVAAVPIEDRQVQRQTAHHAGISRYLA